MGIRTVEEYKSSLRDGRRVYIRGEKVEDVTKHPILGVSVDTVAQGFALTASEDPAVRNLFTAPHPKTGEPINRYFITPRNAEDLALRTKMIQRSIELTGGLPFGKDIGTDCLNAAFVVAGQMGKKQYQENAMNFLEHVRKNDLAMCGAVTCVKGDRSKEPSQQKHPDYYLHVVDKNKDGIVVKGAKIHITSAPAANEIIVVPTRQMRESEADYAVSFAVPANTKGITFICRAGRGALDRPRVSPRPPGPGADRGHDRLRQRLRPLGPGLHVRRVAVLHAPGLHLRHLPPLYRHQLQGPVGGSDGRLRRGHGGVQRAGQSRPHPGQAGGHRRATWRRSGP